MNTSLIDRESGGTGSAARPSATIRGAGELSGGEYRRVSILGAGDVNGDVRAEQLRVIGAGDVYGNAEIGHLAVVGAGELSGDLEADRVRAVGAFTVRGELKARRLRAVGACTVGRILADDARIAGALECSDLEAGSLILRGAADVDGLLSGDTVEIHLGGNSSFVGEIGGGRIEVWRRGFGKGNPFLRALAWLMAFGRFGDRLEVKSVEADDVHLECTRATVVRGRRVSIGAGCSVEDVEYTETLTVHSTARIERRRKI
jgi:cytoskeletal protein CcmA (bactofilin family)